MEVLHLLPCSPEYGIFSFILLYGLIELADLTNTHITLLLLFIYYLLTPTLPNPLENLLSFQYFALVYYRINQQKKERVSKLFLVKTAYSYVFMISGFTSRGKDVFIPLLVFLLFSTKNLLAKRLNYSKIVVLILIICRAKKSIRQ